MKTKIVRMSGHKDISKRVAGISMFRVTGPDENNERRTIFVIGTRKQAESVDLRDYKESQIIDFSEQ